MKMDWANIAKSPIVWVIVGILLLGLAFWFGTMKGSAWADSEYLADRDKRIKEIAVHEQNEKRLAAENETLRLKHEALAEAQRNADTATEAKRLADFQKLQDERERKSSEIENASPGESLAALCADAKAAGLKLSFCQ